ncbi:MAG: hypothetical protein J0L93_03215 [Deltaproteobacteria bacterium]|nr:hypothetical protein [Deltaproteobacteria bacterium]
MSRIVRGESAEVKSVKLMSSTSRAASAYSLKAFTGYHVEGTYTQKELEEYMEKARQEGRRQGAHETESRMMQPLNAALENVENLMDELSRFRRELFKEAEVEVLELIRAVSKRILNRELQIQPDQLKEIVAKAVELIERQRKVFIRISPIDLQMFSEAKKDFLQRFKGLEEVEVHADSSLPKGQALVKSKTLEIDVNIENMVDHLLQKLTSVQTETSETVTDGDKT